MTFASPDEALHFRGKTLTPESPCPVHIPEPANIPVLQHQMDPIFNDTSTYTVSHGSHENAGSHPSILDVRNFGQLQEKGVSNNDSFTVLQNGGDSTLGPVGVAGYPPVTDSFAGSGGSLMQKDSGGPGKENESTFSVAHSSPFSKHMSSAVVPQTSHQDSANNIDLPPPLPSDHTLPPLPPPTSENPSQSPPFLHDPSLPLPPTERISNNETNGYGQLGGDQTMRARDEGVDYQNLLDTLSPSASTAPSAPAVTAATTSAPADLLLLQSTPEKSLQTAQGLPPRPPPQDKPSIHPNYASSDNIRSFHQIPAQTSNISSVFASQQSNYPTNPGLPTVIAAPGAPGASSGANGLPPPPVATFQQATTTQDIGQDGGMDTDASKVSPLEGDYEAPWGADVQKKYDKFLHDERIYVTEGLWDRFPHGSRLFIGKNFRGSFFTNCRFTNNL